MVLALFQSQFCGECVQLWHEGDCPKLSAEQEAAAKVSDHNYQF